MASRIAAAAANERAARGVYPAPRPFFSAVALSLQAMIINCSKMRVAWVMAWVVGCLLLARPAAPTVRSLQLSPTPGSYSLGAQIVCDGDAADAARERT